MVNEDEDEVVDEGLPTEVGQLIDGNGGLDRSEGEEGDGVEGEDREGVEEEEEGRDEVGGGGRKQGGGGRRVGGEQRETGESRRLSKGGGNGGVGRRADLLGG